MTIEQRKMLDKDPEYFHYLLSELGPLVVKYGKDKVMDAIDELEKKYDICK